MKRVVSFSLETELVKKLEDASWQSRKSRSDYLEGIIKSHFGPGPKGEFRETDLDNERLKKKRKKQGVDEKETPKKMVKEPKKGVSVPETFFNPQPKGK